MFRHDPGPCQICGVAHTACTADSGPIGIVQLPARDAAAAALDASVGVQTSAQASPPFVAAVVQATLPPGQFTSGTYRRPKKTP